MFCGTAALKERSGLKVGSTDPRNDDDFQNEPSQKPPSPVTPKILIKALKSLKIHTFKGLFFTPREVTNEILSGNPNVEQDYQLLYFEVSDKLVCAAAAGLIGSKQDFRYYAFDIRQKGSRADSRSELMFWVFYKKLLSKKLEEQKKKIWYVKSATQQADSKDDKTTVKAKETQKGKLTSQIHSKNSNTFIMNPTSTNGPTLSASNSEKTIIRVAVSKKPDECESTNESVNDDQRSTSSAPDSSRSDSLSSNQIKNAPQKLKNRSSPNHSGDNSETPECTSQCSIDEVDRDTEEIPKTITLLERKLDNVSLSLSLKSYEDFVIKPEVSEVSHKDAETKSLDKVSNGKAEKDKTEPEELEGIIKYLYETIKDTKRPLFKNLDRTTKKRVGKCAKTKRPNLKSFGSLQEYYDCTIAEVADVWRNALSLISSVKDHTLKYVDEKCKMIDKEQLTLEAEMLQLAVDFAANYSKLKTDFLVKGVRKRLRVNEQGKSELENFLDSKTFAASYNNEDLAAMAQTVVELNTSVLKGEDAEID